MLVPASRTSTGRRGILPSYLAFVCEQLACNPQIGLMHTGYVAAAIDKARLKTFSAFLDQI